MNQTIYSLASRKSLLPTPKTTKISNHPLGLNQSFRMPAKTLKKPPVPGHTVRRNNFNKYLIESHKTLPKYSEL